VDVGNDRHSALLDDLREGARVFLVRNGDPHDVRTLDREFVNLMIVSCAFSVFVVVID